MGSADRVHDRELLDRLEAMSGIALDATVWRTARLGRDATRGTNAHGRWSAAGEIEVLYTSMVSDGSLAEIGYRLTLEPIWPSRIRHELSQLSVKLENVCDLSELKILADLGLEVAQFEGHNYAVEQAISAAARFLEFDGILVPNARHNSSNLVIYTEIVDPGLISVVSAKEVDWAAWRATNRSRPSRSR